MSEVSMTSLVTPKVIDTTSSKGVVEVKADAGGKNLPQVEANSAQTQLTQSQSSEAPAAIEQVETAVTSVNEFVQSIQRDLHFTVDKELDRTVIKVVDKDTGDVVRQIPEDIFLELARRLKDDGEMHLLDALG